MILRMFRFYSFLVNYLSLRFEIQRLRNECNFLTQQVDQMRRQNSNDKFPSKMKEYLLRADKQIAAVEILIQQSQVSQSPIDVTNSKV